MDVDKILEGLAEHNLIRISKPIGDWYSIYCPFHSNGQEKNPSCGVSRVKQVRGGSVFEEGTFHCFACGEVKSFYEAIQYILDQHGIQTESALDWLSENIPGFDASEHEFDYLIPHETIQNLNAIFATNYLKYKTESKPNYVSEDKLVKYRFTVPYMYDRKLNDAVIQKFDVGVDINFVPSGKKKPVPTITFPVRNPDGNVLFIYRRAINSKQFYMPQGLEKPVYGLYELPKHASKVVICESIFNALTCYVYGIPAVALFGTGTKSQIESLKLIGVKEFILGLDPDDAGEQGCSKLRKALSSVAIIRRMHIPAGKDINDLTQDEFNEALAERI